MPQPAQNDIPHSLKITSFVNRALHFLLILLKEFKNRLLWCMDSVELKALGKQQTQGQALSKLPSSA